MNNQPIVLAFKDVLADVENKMAAIAVFPILNFD